MSTVTTKQFSQRPQAVHACTLLLFLSQARFKRGATAVPNLIDQLNSTLVLQYRDV